MTEFEELCRSKGLATMMRAPWKGSPTAQDASGYVLPIVVNRDGNPVGRTISGWEARLLAAAPDMLAALIKVDEDLEMDYGCTANNETFIMARAAIAKAFGR